MFNFFHKKKKAQLGDVADAIAFANRSGKYYYKKSEEEVVLRPDRAFSVGVSDPELEKDIKEHPEDYIAIPVLTMADEMQLMMNYAKLQKDRNLQEELIRTLQKPGAMRSFQARIRSDGLKEDWDRYRCYICMRVAEDWAKENGLKGIRPSTGKRGV